MHPGAWRAGSVFADLADGLFSIEWGRTRISRPPSDRHALSGAQDRSVDAVVIATAERLNAEGIGDARPAPLCRGLDGEPPSLPATADGRSQDEAQKSQAPPGPLLANGAAATHFSAVDGHSGNHALFETNPEATLR
jgi:hypothetical protein